MRAHRIFTLAYIAKGYGAATLREVAASLDLSPGAVYPHYKTKESLLFAISWEGHHSVLAAITGADRPAASRIDRLKSTFSLVSRYVELALRMVGATA